MKQKIKRRISSLICFVMVLSMLVQNSVQTVWAWPGNPGGTVQSMGDAPESEELSVTDDVSAEDGTFEAAEVLQEESEEPVILHEIEENRGEFSKEYLRSDNSRMLIVYPQQIHFEAEDGSLVEIDNSLIKTEEGYRNGSNSYDVFISDNADSQGKVCYKEGNYEISWQMVEIVEETTEQDSKQDDSSEKKE